MRRDRDTLLGWCALAAVLLASGAASGQALAQAVPDLVEHEISKFAMSARATTARPSVVSRTTEPGPSDRTTPDRT